MIDVELIKEQLETYNSLLKKRDKYKSKIFETEKELYFLSLPLKHNCCNITINDNRKTEYKIPICLNNKINDTLLNLFNDGTIKKTIEDKLRPELQKKYDKAVEELNLINTTLKQYTNT